MVFNRDKGFSINLVDPDDLDAIQKITGALTIRDNLYIFTTTSIYRVLTADTLDPDRKHPETLHTYEKIYSIGSQKLMVARTIIQFNDIFKFLSSPLNQEELLDRLWTCTMHLLDCEKASFYVYDQTMKLMPVCDKIIEENKVTGRIPALPKISDLDTYVSHFLMSGKHMLVETFGFLHDFFGMPYSATNFAHFDKHIEWITKKFGDEHALNKMLHNDKNWIQIISACSNAIRHPEPNQSVNIQNISIKAGNKFSTPSWKYNLTKKGLGEYQHHVDLISDLDAFCHNMMTFLEELLLSSIDEVFKTSNMLCLQEFSDVETNKDCPVKYRVGARASFLSAQPK